MVAQFFYRYFPHYESWENYPAWLKWADEHGFIQLVYPDERKEKIVAAAVVRPINELQLTRYNVYEYDTRGHILYIDDLAADSKDAFRAIGIAIVRRFGPRVKVAFSTRKQKLRIHDWTNARKSLFKVRQHEFPQPTNSAPSS